jgi:hypothetical protein
LFYIELDQCVSLFKEAFPPENMLWRKLPQAVGHKGKKDYDAKVLQAKYPYFRDLGRSLILRMETPQRTDCVSLVGLAQVAAYADEVRKNIRQGYDSGTFEAGPDSLRDEDLLAFDAF